VYQAPVLLRSLAERLAS